MSKQFCPRGHDTFVVGRTKNSTCRTCQGSFRRESDRKAGAKKSKWKQRPENRDRHLMTRRVSELRRKIKARREVKLQRIAELIEELQ